MATTATLDPTELFGPAPTGIKGAMTRFAMGKVPTVFRLLRRYKPIVSLGKMVVTSRYDDVREVFATDQAFGVPYKEHLDLIMGGEPFFLGMNDTPQYRADSAAMWALMPPGDVAARIAPAVEAMAERLVDEAGGRIEVVDQLVRRVTFDVLADYFGVTDPPGGDLRILGTQLFKFQFLGGDAAQMAPVAKSLRDHIQSLIEARRAAGTGPDNLLGRAVDRQLRGEAIYTDAWIRTALTGFVVGGPPQPPMVVPQAMEQLLQRPGILAEAQAAARADDDATLARYVFEAMRFDPLAPALPRVALKDHVLAAGTSRATRIAAGSKVMAAMSSAMRDERRIPDPERFDPRRLPYEYMHFGYGLHTCFGRLINKGTLHLMLKPLLKRRNLRRAGGKLGRLTKRGAFAERLWVVYD
ncbi:MAG TPA: cytochrome P450 [Allosphingosinicella sp.]|nr:cytochrome P450 [Allosphingosinicella sp.]